MFIGIGMGWDGTIFGALRGDGTGLGGEERVGGGGRWGGGLDDWGKSCVCECVCVCVCCFGFRRMRPWRYFRYIDLFFSLPFPFCLFALLFFSSDCGSGIGGTCFVIGCDDGGGFRWR